MTIPNSTLKRMQGGTRLRRTICGRRACHNLWRDPEPNVHRDLHRRQERLRKRKKTANSLCFSGKCVTIGQRICKNRVKLTPNGKSQIGALPEVVRLTRTYMRKSVRNLVMGLSAITAVAAGPSLQNGPHPPEVINCKERALPNPAPSGARDTP